MHTPFGRYWRLLVTYLKPQWPRVVLLSILLGGNITLQLINPQVVRYFIDATQTGQPLSVLLVAGGLFLAIAFLQRAVAFSSTYSAENVGWTATNALRADLALHCLRMDMSFHKTRTPGELIERIDSDVTTLASFFSQFTIQVLVNALLIGGVLILLWREDWRVGVALTVFSILTFVSLRLLQNIAVKQWASEREANAGFYGFLEEHLTGTEDIRAAGAEAYITRLMFTLMHRLLKTHRRARMVSNLTFFSTNFLYVMAILSDWLSERTCTSNIRSRLAQPTCLSITSVCFPPHCKPSRSRLKICKKHPPALSVSRSYSVCNRALRSRRVGRCRTTRWP